MLLLAMSFTPARARYDASLEALKRHFRFILQRDLTPHEERWLELSAPLLPLDEGRESEQPVSLEKSA